MSRLQFIPDCIDDPDWIKCQDHCGDCHYCDDPWDCTIPQLLNFFPEVREFLKQLD